MIICDWCGIQFDHATTYPELPLFRATAGWKVGCHRDKHWWEEPWMCPDCVAEGWILELGPGLFASTRKVG